MIGLSNRDILVCMGEPVRKRWVAQATEIWDLSGRRDDDRRRRPAASTAARRRGPFPAT